MCVQLFMYIIVMNSRRSDIFYYEDMSKKNFHTESLLNYFAIGPRNKWKQILLAPMK